MMKPSERLEIDTKSLIKKFLFMYNDGIGFFSPMAEHKLRRLVGAKPGWFDKFKSIKNMFLYLVSFSITVTIIA